MQKKESKKPGNILGQNSQKPFTALFVRFLDSAECTLLILGIFASVLLYMYSAKLSFRLDTDYNVAIPMAQFAINAVTKPEWFLMRNPHIGFGLPIFGDPSSFAVSPLLLPLFVLFGPVGGIKMSIYASILLSGLTMSWALFRLQFPGRIRLWASVLYMFSGGLAALIASGHVERFFSYALTPLAFSFLWDREMKTIRSVGLGIIIACMYLTLDIYTPWFLSLFIVLFMVYSVWKGVLTPSQAVKKTTIVFVSAVFLSLPKLISFFTEIAPMFRRVGYIDAFAGSIHAFLLPLQYAVPFQVSFYDRPSLQRMLGFTYNWYEYYAFISPLSLVPLYWVLFIKKKPHVLLFSVSVVVVGALYLAIKYPYSPFYWLFSAFPILSVFRVPQRIALPLLVPLLVLISYGIVHAFQSLSAGGKRVLTVILVCACIWTAGVFAYTVRSAFAPFRTLESSVASELRKKDQGKYFVANFACCMQPFLLEQGIPILNYYYGWVPKNWPTFMDKSGTSRDYSALLKYRPTYIISPEGADFEYYGYYPFISKGSITVWKTSVANVFPSI